MFLFYKFPLGTILTVSHNYLYVVFRIYVCTCVLSRFSHVQLFEIPWTIAHQAPLSKESSRQEYWSGLPCPPPGDLPHRRIKPAFLRSSELTGRFFTICATREAHTLCFTSCPCLKVFSGRLLHLK